MSRIIFMNYLAKLLQHSPRVQETKAHVLPKKRQFGSAKGKFHYPQNFDEDNEEIACLFGAI